MAIFTRKRAVALLLLLGIVGVGVSLGSRRVRAYFLCNAGMIAVENDDRIYVESGTDEAWIKEVAAVLDKAINRVEDMHGSQFPDDVRVYLCGSQESYNRRTGDPKNGIARGAVFAVRVFLSPRCITTNSTESILTHELSHLQLRQLLGTPYITGTPGWFQEGLAVYLSGGGGAEPVTEQEASNAIVQGIELSPESHGSFPPRLGQEHGMGHFMFYRQSAMFVEFLVEKNNEGVHSLVGSLESGNKFENAFRAAFLGSTQDLWSEFAAQFKQRR